MTSVAVLTVIGLLGVYILSPVPVMYVMVHGFGNYEADGNSLFGAVYYPLDWAMQKFPAVEAFYTWQMVACGLLS